MTEAMVGELLAELPGVAHRPGGEAYSAATTPDNSSCPQHPCAVVRARTADDVARAVVPRCV